MTSKSDIRTWNKASGSGKLFSMDLMDESGEIRATAFKEQVDQYYDMIQVKKFYMSSLGAVRFLQSLLRPTLFFDEMRGILFVKIKRSPGRFKLKNSSG